jgi:hypothetical protein
MCHLLWTSCDERIIELYPGWKDKVDLNGRCRDCGFRPKDHYVHSPTCLNILGEVFTPQFEVVILLPALYPGCPAGSEVWF